MKINFDSYGVKKVLRALSYKVLAVAAMLFGFNSCHLTKYIPEGESLYRGASVKIISVDPVNEEKILKASLTEVLKPKENASIVGLKPQLAFYYRSKTIKNNKLAKIVGEKLGEAPVYISSVSPERTVVQLKNKLNNQGYLNAQVDYKLISQKAGVKIEYTVLLRAPFIIKHVTYTQTDDVLSEYLRASEGESLLQSGRVYNLETLIEERERINKAFKEAGFYYFNPEFILFKIDSTAGDNSLSVHVGFHENIPENASKIYKIGNIYLNAEYQLGAEKITLDKYSEWTSPSYFIYDTNNQFKADILFRSIYFQPGSKYELGNHNLSLNHLMGLGIFKFVTIKFEEFISRDSIETNAPVLDIFISLTAFSKNSVRMELNAASKSSNYLGPGLNLSYKNKNTFKGAELLFIKLNSGFETQINNQQKGLNSYLLGWDGELYIPRYFTPFGILPNKKTIYVPKTRIRLGYQYIDRVNFYVLNSFNTSYGFVWNENERKKHELNPLNISFVNSSNLSREFALLLNSKNHLKSSFERQFIPAFYYSFTYNSISDKRLRNPIYYFGSIETAGNVFYGMQRFLSGGSVDSMPYKILKVPYSNYLRLENDCRYYYKIDRRSKLVNRVLLGFGIPYFNSNSLPYIKQFSIGGPYSIRAFLIRSVGPGIYQPNLENSGGLFLDQTGDLKFEMNSEYRFDIYKVIKGAAFIDAGNVWQFKKEEALPGGEFQANLFYKQLAVGGGMGIRIDLNYFVIRFDWATPLRKPYVAENNGWAFRSFNFKEGAWRKNNLVFNLAIGYPF